MKPISRRRMILNLALVAGGALFSTSCARSLRPQGANQLNIYSWADYLHPDTIPTFQKNFGIQVFYDTFASNEALLAKLQAGATDYDIVVPSSYMVRPLIKLGLLSQIEHDRLSNLDNIMSRFLNPTFDPGLGHTVPYSWGTTGIGYNRDALLAVLGKEPENVDEIKIGDFNVFWDERFTNRITLLDDERETIGMSVKRLGGSYNCQDPAKIRQAVSELVKQKRLLMCYSSDQVIIQLASGDSWISLGYSGDVAQARRANDSVRYVVPQSGTSTWVDSFAILKSAPHKEAAYKWIDFLLDPAVAAKNAEYTRYATPNAMAMKHLDEALKADKNIYLPETLLNRCETVLEAGKLTFLYDQLWTELKCS